MHDLYSLDAGHGSITIAQHGARVLACGLPDVPGNLFYENDTHTGGDRLWIAPEVAYFWPSLEKARQDPIKYAHTPEAVDPAHYQVTEETDRFVQLNTTMALTDTRNGANIAFEVRRTIATAGPPPTLPEGLACVSFTITNDLAMKHGDDGALVGAWDILQVPPTGTLICPTTRRAEVTSYYDPFGEKHVQVEDHRVRFLIDRQRRIKMGIPADATTGRMAYYRVVDGVATLIVRLFNALPGESYVDVPRSAAPTQRLGTDALQAYCDDGTFGDFGEMEYHDPALVVGQTVPCRTSTCITHAVAGDDVAIRAFGESLLGVSVNPID